MPGEQSMPALQQRISELESERVRLLQIVAKVKEIADTNDGALKLTPEQIPDTDRVLHQFSGLLQAYIDCRSECDTMRQELEKLRGGG